MTMTSYSGVGTALFIVGLYVPKATVHNLSPTWPLLGLLHSFILPVHWKDRHRNFLKAKNFKVSFPIH